MSGPARRAAERQAARRGATTRPSSGSTSARSTTARTARSAGTGADATSTRTARAAVAARPSLTGRAVVLAIVLALLVFTLAVPARSLLKQRADINALRAQNAATQARVDDLTVREERLKDPAYVTSLVRERLHYVLPGEVGYVVLDPNEAPAPSAARTDTPVTAWYSSLWSAVSTTDQAGQPQPATGIPVRPNAPR
ncbi:MAG: septum formation initiator family protein [Frankiales bacterium]|nr:septum formation initiator family protein [Frankiales bacterium]